MLPALSLNGILHLTAQKDAYKSEDFVRFISGVLDAMNTYPAKNSVIIMDNMSIHKAACLRPMIEQRYASGHSTPTYRFHLLTAQRHTTRVPSTILT